MDASSEVKILDGVLKKYFGSGGTVCVPEGVEEISSFAFRYKKITALILPSTLRKISDCAFYGCEKLRRVEFNEGLESIGAGAFLGCRELREITLPPYLRRIESCAFENCLSLRRADIPEWTDYIGEFAFKGCGAIEINIPGETDCERVIADAEASVYAPSAMLGDVPEKARFSLCLGACRGDKKLSAQYREYIRENREAFIEAADRTGVLAALIGMRLLSEQETQQLMERLDNAALAGMLMEYRKEMFAAADPFAEFEL